MTSPILSRLADLGYVVGSVDELRESGLRYASAVPVLIAALNSSVDRRDQEVLVRALSVPWAAPEALGPLISLFREADDASGLGLRWAVGNALEVLWDDSRFDDLVDLCCDRSFGRAREMLVLGLARSKRPEAGEVLIGLLDDGDVNGHAVLALSRLNVAEARQGIESMKHDDRAWVRKAVASALAKLPAGGGTKAPGNEAGVPPVPGFGGGRQPDPLLGRPDRNQLRDARGRLRC